MESYFQAKRMLFCDFNLNVAVINIDDPYGKRLFNSLKDGRIRLTTYGIREDAELKAEAIRTGIEETSLTLDYKGASYSVKSPLLGITNVYNLLSAIGSMLALGFQIERLIELVPGLRPAEGRMELIKEGQPFTVVVDYAHTPDALKKLLETVREFATGRLITVFGCGGNRDRKKRPEMGAIAERLSDVVIVTTDNPRYEDEREIIRDILGGMKDSKHMVVVDRAEAIAEAVKLCRPNDVLVIAGKGHEDYQEIRGKRIHFDDREVVRGAIKRL
jgi:UDP-N-acetylmuramoyl-L-alanyl-D-glutamate--2,6-diaminopimelate ligase